METFLEFLREVGAYFFRKNVVEHKKTTLRRHKQKGGSRKNIKINFDNYHPDGRSCREKFLTESKTGA